MYDAVARMEQEALQAGKKSQLYRMAAGNANDHSARVTLNGMAGVEYAFAQFLGDTVKRMRGKA